MGDKKGGEKRKMWNIKFERKGALWHSFTQDQKDSVQTLLYLTFGAGIIFGMFIGICF